MASPLRGGEHGGRGNCLAASASTHRWGFLLATWRTAIHSDAAVGQAVVLFGKTVLNEAYAAGATQDDGTVEAGIYCEWISMLFACVSFVSLNGLDQLEHAGRIPALLRHGSSMIETNSAELISAHIHLRRRLSGRVLG